jgi:large subunit ribosomal protein L25
VTVELPIRFDGVSAGLKAGGKLMQKLRRVKIKATPENLIDEIALDVTSLQLGQSIRVRDIKAGEGIEILNSPGIPIASVEIPRALKGPEETAPAAAAGAAATPAAGAPAAAAPAAPEAGKKAEPAKKEGGKK